MVPPPTTTKRRANQKSTHSRSYPRGVGLDFRKLAGLTLMSYIDHHGVSVRAEAPPSELAVAVARHFESLDVDEETVVSGFLSRLEAGGQSHSTSAASAPTEYARNTAHFDGLALSVGVRKRKRSKMAARPGEQVAAKVTRTDENGSWILASVQRFYGDTETYDVQDEDDTSKLIRLPWNHVMRLSTGTEGSFTRGMECMAIFPETTSFYRAVVSKHPVWKLTAGSTTPTVKELIVKFEDDEDDNGRTPHRRVPSRYVIPIPTKYFYEESDDVDLTPPSSSSSTAAVMSSHHHHHAAATGGGGGGGGGVHHHHHHHHHHSSSSSHHYHRGSGNGGGRGGGVGSGGVHHQQHHRS